MKKSPHAYGHAPTSGISRMLCLLLFLSISALTAWSQTNSTITGKVTDSKNAPMEGVSVLIKGTKRGVTTGSGGTFSFPNVPANATLVFSYTGYADKEMAVKAGAPVNVSLTEVATGLNDVVVVGYGTATKKDLTGSVAQVKATQLENENPRSVQDILRGNAPGLDVGFDGSTKGSNASMQIRGRGSLTASTAPLVVLDGVIYPGGLEDVNPNDIATIDVLKDASAAAVFGSRGSNGIILITTKRGKVGKPIVTVNANVGFNKVSAKPHLLNASEFLSFRSDALWAINGFDSTSKPGVKYKFTDPTKLPSDITVAQWMALDASTGDPTVAWLNRLRMKPIEISNYQAGKTLDWENLIYNQNSLQQDYTVSVTQRKDDYNYYFSLGYLDNQGITVGDRYKTLRARINLEANVSKYLTVGINAQFAERDESSILVPLSDVLQTTPYGSIYTDDGSQLRLSPNDDPGNNTNPFIPQQYQDRMYKYDNFFANLFAKGKLPYGFSYEVHFAPTYNTLREYNHVDATHPVQIARKGIVDRRNRTDYNWTTDFIMRWNGKFNKHTIEATFLANAEKNQYWDTRIHAENFAPNDNLSFNAIQSATIPYTASSDDRYVTRDALMGRVSYNYDQRYFLTATARRDGYSGFGAANRRAVFPSLSVAWAFSEESFMKNTSKWLDYAKLRVSWGQNGNSAIDPFQALATLGAGTYIYTSPSGATNSQVSVFSSNLANPDLKWEKKIATNVGIDYSIFKGVVSGSFDYYIANTKDLLVQRTLPTITGFNSIFANLGEVKNTGFEMSVTTQNMKKLNFDWRTTVSFWFNKNEIVHLYGPTPDYDATGKQIGTSEKDDINNGWFIGHNISDQYNYNVVGVWQASEAAEAKKYGYKPGDFKIQDTNGDGAYTIADKVFMGTTTPKYSFNLRNDFRIYKNFDFAFTLYGKIGQIYQMNEAKNVDRFYDRANFFQRPYWTPSNPINDYAAINSNASGAVTWNYYRKASFVRLSNISLGYNVPATTAKKWGFESIKAYVNVVNAAVFTGWNYFDPEYKGPDANNPTNLAPVPLQMNFGINVNL